MADIATDDDAGVKRAVEAFAQGFQYRVHDLGGYDGYEPWIEKIEGFRVEYRLMERLAREGWIEPYGARGYQLTDAGRAAYIRSTDELQDGKLIPPCAQNGTSDSGKP